MRKIYYALLKWIRSLAIKNKTVTVVSNNCWGGFMYQSCKLQYHTPFIGLFMVAPDYIKLLENFDEFTVLYFLNVGKILSIAII